MSGNRFWKKAGWFVVSLLPAALSLAMQLGSAMVLLIIISFFVGFTRHGTGMNQAELADFALNAFMRNIVWAVVLYQIMGILVFGLWYYLVYGRKKRPAGVEKPGMKEIAVIVVLGCLLQILISGLLGIISMLFPDLLNSYAEMMKTAGIGETTVAAFIATVFFAPVGEELLCRGIIFRLAGKVSSRFWVANCIQALAFAIIHANLVQGAYAFLLGVILGYIYGKYRNIWVCMLLHGVINCSSNFVSYIWGILPQKNEMLGVGLICALALVLTILVMKLLGEIKPVEENHGNMVSY